MDGEALLQTCILSIFPWTKSDIVPSPPPPPLPPPGGKTDRLCLATERSPEQDRHAFLPSFQVVDRQDCADGSAVSDAELEETAANQVETDPAVESRGRSLAQLQRSADFPKFGKEKEQETNSFFFFKPEYS